MEDIIESIIQMEWEFFDKVENEGGRASCQDNWETFSKMRRSQYMAWPLPLLESWKADLVRANEEGRNPLTEKYGYMMCISDPEGPPDSRQAHSAERDFPLQISPGFRPWPSPEDIRGTRRRLDLHRDLRAGGTLDLLAKDPGAF